MRARHHISTLAALLLATSLYGAEPWDVPFAGDVRAIVKAARDVSVPDDQAIVILLEQHRYVIDESGRTAFTIRKVYRILKEDDIEDWSSIEQGYQPWHESKPELRARVITEDGMVHWLDPKTIGDSPATEYDASIFSDRRVARAPLPAIRVGAVIEYEIAVRETSPLLDAGEVRRITVYDGIPIQSFRLSIEAPAGVELKSVAKLIPDSAIRRSSGNGKSRFECDWGPVAPRKHFEGNLPADVPSFPYVAFSTGKSWQEIASRYETIVDQQIRSGDVNPFLRGLDRTGSTLEIATRLVARLHKEIRYTGVEFGESEIVPHTPDETQKRKYGDCKDKASLLVAMLRAAGLRASVALLNAGFGTDVDGELPGLGLFNHAIVFVEAEKPLWIDATSAETRVGQLPSMDQGRLALIANRSAKSLVPTPESRSNENTRTDTIELRLSDYGPGELQETMEAQGAMETRMRQMYDGSDEKKVKESLEKYLKRDYLAKSIGQFNVTKKDDFSESFHLRVEGRDVKRAFTEEDDAVAVLFPSLIFQEMPYALTHKTPETSEDREEEVRKNDFVFNEPHVIELHYKIHPPAFFRVKDLPASKDLKLGTAAFARRYQTNQDGTVDAVFRLDTGKRRLSPAEFTQLRAELREVFTPSPQMLTFVSEASEYVAMGETRKALKLMSTDTPGQPGAKQVRVSRMLVTAGAVPSAIRMARKIVEQLPSSQEAWQSLAWAYEHDHFGRMFRGDWNAAEAEKCYRQALKLDPEDFMAKVNLAILLQYNSEGLLYGKGARLEESVQFYREILKTMPNPEVQQNLAVALLFAEHYAEAKEEVAKLPETEVHYVLSTVLTALTDNSARAIIDSQTRIPDQRARVTILGQAGQTLGQLRQYDRALDLLKAAARLSNTHELQGQLDYLSRMKRYDQILVQETDPHYPVQQVLLSLYSRDFNFDAVKAQFTKREDWTPLREGILKLRPHVQAWRSMMTSQGWGSESILDAALSTQEFGKSSGAEISGDEAHGFRFSASSQVWQMPVMYVVRENGKYLILGTSKNPEEIGRRVLDLLAEKDLKGAQWWLDKVVPDQQSDRSDGAGGPAVRFLWSGVTPETRGAEAITVAAASLIGPHTGSEQAIQTLREARAKTSVQLVKGQIDMALCESLEKAAKWDELLAAAKRLEGLRLFERDGFRFLARAATALEKWKELQTEATQRVKNAHQDIEALEALIISAIHNGDDGAAAASLGQLALLPYAGPEELEFEAWASMLRGKPDEDVLAKLGKNTELPELSTPAFWYALGMLQAVMNKPEEAQQSLTKALDQEDWDTLDAKPWALAGQIYRQYGLEEEAAEAFAKARASTRSAESAKWALSIVLRTEAGPSEKATPASKMQ
jgi:tetratricopeptide (TPR) repeat protein